jgi:hypothetical protein
MKKKQENSVDYGYLGFMLLMAIPGLVVGTMLLGMFQYTALIFPIEKAICAENNAGIMTGMGEPSIMSVENETYFRCRQVQNGTERIIAVKVNKTWIG